MEIFKNILLVSDTDHEDPQVIEQVIVLASRNQAKLTIMNIIKKLTSELKRFTFFVIE